MRGRFFFKFKRFYSLLSRTMNKNTCKRAFYSTLVSSILLVIAIGTISQFNKNNNKKLIEFYQQKLKLYNGTKIKMQRLPNAIIIGVSKCGKNGILIFFLN